MKNDTMTIQIMPEHASWCSRGLSRAVSRACDAFFESHGQKKMTMQDMRNAMFDRKRKRKR